ncbi:malonyl-CoA:anthocyanidin 5-O-glucoside-6''-O-malonyltransferase [Manihot esculenta]|uniref:Uncharacterized protein n=1 Tax=Manihot esculenta TaxID=3983 RepID=A0A2C9WDS7_MANES|nr:malonyl-CoA:anthocyanidin 5-O-glucoside-6''-O-malonyltransferase [Manihot esculenta]OAY56919.1 hypothetical protein MANES_02G055700v8 [Manihot esculenta]
MASINNQVRVLEICQVTSFSDSPDSATELSLPLTFFDTFWFKFPPTERIFFYQLTDATPAFFHSVILPKLKQSLSLTLLHFLPLAGKLTWPPHAAKPFILYAPNNAIPISIAESDADFHHLSDTIHEADESHPYIPELPVSDSCADIISLQITLFPNQGFCIGISSHHAILDGKSVTMFIRAWAHICKHSQNEKNPTLLPELTPIFDRTMIQDPEGLDMVYLNNWLSIFKSIGFDGNPRTLKLLPAFNGLPANLVRGTFELSREALKKLRQKVLSQLERVDPEQTKTIHLSTFVLTLAYAVVSIVKAKGLERNTKVVFAFTADCRARLEPPLPANYFGNCVSGYNDATEAEVLMEENGIAFVVQRLSKLIKGLEKGALEGAKNKLESFMEKKPDSLEVIGVAGSPRFQVYESDFGWGRPKMVEVTSIDRTGSISMAESKDESGGVEIGIVLKQHEMEKFDSLFINGLKE